MSQKCDKPKRKLLWYLFTKNIWLTWIWTRNNYWLVIFLLVQNRQQRRNVLRKIKTVAINFGKNLRKEKYIKSIFKNVISHFGKKAINLIDPRSETYFVNNYLSKFIVTVQHKSSKLNAGKFSQAHSQNSHSKSVVHPDFSFIRRKNNFSSSLNTNISVSYTHLTLPTNREV